MTSVFRFTALLAALAMTASIAHAYSGGSLGSSGRQGVNCAQCHSGSGGTIAYFLTPVNAAYPPLASGYVPGATYDVTVTVSGGPAVQFGFAWDADGGVGTVTDPANTQRSTNPAFPANFTHTSPGNDQSSWSFQWTAPIDGSTVTFWGSGASTNGGGTSGDAPTPTISIQADPIPEYLCRVGNVNAATGTTVDVVFVNGSPGVGPERELVVGQSDPFSLALVEPPSIPGGPAPFVLYFHRGTPSASSVRVLPRGVGTICNPIPLTDSSIPTLLKITNNIGRPSKLGVSDFPSSPAPSVVATRPRGVGLTLTVFVQGLIIDSLSPQGQAAVTNGLLVRFVP
jgi:hypothetical protein